MWRNNAKQIISIKFIVQSSTIIIKSEVPNFKLTSNSTQMVASRGRYHKSHNKLYVCGNKITFMVSIKKLCSTGDSVNLFYKNYNYEIERREKTLHRRRWKTSKKEKYKNTTIRMSVIFKRYWFFFTFMFDRTPSGSHILTHFYVKLATFSGCNEGAWSLND